MSHGYHNDDLDDIGNDVKGEPDSPGMGLAVLLALLIGGYMVFHGHGQHHVVQQPTPTHAPCPK